MNTRFFPVYFWHFKNELKCVILNLLPLSQKGVSWTPLAFMNSLSINCNGMFIQDKLSLSTTLAHLYHTKKCLARLASLKSSQAPLQGLDQPPLPSHGYAVFTTIITTTSATATTATLMFTLINIEEG